MSTHRPHPAYALANIDGLPDRPAVFELLGVNEHDNSYIATCVSAAAGVVCKPGRLASTDIIARFASRETAFTVLAERTQNVKDALAVQHELPLIHPAPVETNATMLAETPIMRFFHYAHLPDGLREISKHFAELALMMVNTLPPSAERTAGLRKLLEAKDCAVRASLPVAGEPR